MSQPGFLPPLITAAPVFLTSARGSEELVMAGGSVKPLWLTVRCDAFAFASARSMRTSNSTEDNGPFIYCALPSSDSPGF